MPYVSTGNNSMANKNNIKAIREKLSITQEELAKAFDVSPRTVIRWENGSSAPQGAAAKKLQTLFELMANTQSLKELIEAAKGPDGIEILRSMLNPAERLTILEKASIGSTRGKGTLGLATMLGIVGGSTSLWGAYKFLKKAYEGNSPESAALISTHFKCGVCGEQETKELFHCVGVLADGNPCRFVVCKKCIYSSKEAHAKLSPTCSCLDVPSLEPIED
jgi:DNA-binding XRE family transcriptional regulator